MGHSLVRGVALWSALKRRLARFFQGQSRTLFKNEMRFRMGLQNVSRVYAVVFAKICQVIASEGLCQGRNIVACRGGGQTIFGGSFSEQIRSIVKSYLKAKNV